MSNSSPKYRAVSGKISLKKLESEATIFPKTYIWCRVVEGALLGHKKWSGDE